MTETDRLLNPINSQRQDQRNNASRGLKEWIDDHLFRNSEGTESRFGRFCGNLYALLYPQDIRDDETPPGRFWQWISDPLLLSILYHLFIGVLITISFTWKTAAAFPKTLAVNSRANDFNHLGFLTSFMIISIAIMHVNLFRQIRQKTERDHWIIPAHDFALILLLIGLTVTFYCWSVAMLIVEADKYNSHLSWENALKWAKATVANQIVSLYVLLRLIFENVPQPKFLKLLLYVRNANSAASEVS